MPGLFSFSWDDEAWRRVGKRAHVCAACLVGFGSRPSLVSDHERRDSEGGNASWVRATMRLAASLLAHGVDTRPMIGEVRSLPIENKFQAPGAEPNGRHPFFVNQSGGRSVNAF